MNEGCLRLDRLTGKRFLVLGLGRSGMAASRLLRALDREVRCTDDRLDQAASADVNQLKALNAEIFPATPQALDKIDTLIISPGVPAWHPLALAAKERGIPVLGEMELAVRLLDIPLIAVTGTNGKSSVVKIVSHILAAEGVPHRLAGNIGNAICGELDTLTGKERFVVLEVSSFQLEHIDLFCPAIACVLNIAPDHLNRYHSFEHYAATKWEISRNQREDDALLVGSRLWSHAPDWIAARRLAFAEDEALDAVMQGVDLRGGSVVWREGTRRETSALPRSVAGRRGHLMANSLAALGIARLAGVALPSALEALQDYEELPHRLQPVRRHLGVTYIDDSKATNVHAAVAALSSVSDPVVLIAGGAGKGESFQSLGQAALDRVVGLVLMGETAETMRREMLLPVKTEMVSSMAQAVDAAARMAQPGDVVLLSPAAASLDMFNSYAHRGDCFREEVAKL